MAVSTANKNFGRQYPLVATQTITYADVAGGTAQAVLDVRPGTRIIGGFLKVDTVWNGTTPLLDLGDDGDADRYTASQIDLTAVATTALTITGYKYTESNTIDATISVTGTPSQGSATLVVMYVIDGRANEVEPKYT